MKYLLIPIFILMSLLPLSSQKVRANYEYSLSSGGMIEITPELYDSLFKSTIDIKDSITKRTVEITKLYDLYYAKRDKTFKGMTNLPLPDFEAKDTEGYDHSTYKYRGRVLILHFWLFWSSSFDKEIPELNKLVDKYQKDGLAVLSLTSLPLGDSEKQKLKENPLNFPLIENAYEFANAYFKMQLMRPCFIIVDKNGTMRYFYDSNLVESKMLLKSENQLSDFEQKIVDLLK
jgi:peroxiredoxin